MIPSVASTTLSETTVHVSSLDDTADGEFVNITTNLKVVGHS